MTGDFTRWTFDGRKRYRAVLQQQGRVTLDADINEQAAIDSARADFLGEATIGPVGRPKGEFVVAPAGGDLSIGAGSVFLGGTPCVNDADCTLLSQPHRPLPQETTAALGDLAPGPGTYAVVLSAFPRIVTPLIDPDLRETALGGADTAVREQWVWQVRLKRFDPPAGTTCETVGDAWRGPFTPGRMSARTKTPAVPADPCQIPPAAQYRRFDNQLYRIEIHKAGNRATARFKWARDNASTATAVLPAEPAAVQTAGPKLSVASLGRDAESGFSALAWTELTDDVLELSRQPVPLRRIDTIAPATREVTLQAAAALPVSFDRHPRLRLWHGGAEDGLPLSADVDLEDGIAIGFAEGDYRVGDYWLIPARTAVEGQVGDIEWPRDAAGPLALPSRLDERSCLLTVVRWDGAAFSTLPEFGQCVPEFPPLTAITADDVSYSPSPGPLAGADTVQEAIDLLAQYTGACTVVVRPGPDWFAPLLALPAGSDAAICFQVGTFTAPPKGLDLAGLGHVKITGAGPGTRIVNPAGEIAIRITRARSATVRDLAVEGKPTTAGDSLNGALTVVDCPVVRIEAIVASIGSAPRPRAACITVRNEPPRQLVRGTGLVHVSGCTLSCDGGQNGLLVVNASRATVENNVVHASKVISHVSRLEVLQNRQLRTLLVKALASSAQVVDRSVQPRRDQMQVAIGRKQLLFATQPELQPFWRRYLEAEPALRDFNEMTAARGIADLSKSLIRNPDIWIRNPELGRFIDRWLVMPQLGDRGICIAGSHLDEARVSGNSVSGFRSGVHIALSHREARRGAPDRARAITVEDNEIEVKLLPGFTATNLKEEPRRPFGVYIGNAEDIVVTRNRIIQPSTSQRAHAAVYIHGHIGNRCDATDNRVENVLTGFWLTRLDEPQGSTLYRCAGNMCLRVQTPFMGPFAWPPHVNNVSFA